MRHLNDQYYGGNRLREVGTPVAGADAANKAYVDAAVANAGGGGHAALDVTDDNNGNIAVALKSSSYELSVTDDNAGNITLSFN